MSRIPDNLESKYNKDSKFIWVDSQDLNERISS